MKLNKIFFSPTNTTKKILDGISKGISAKKVTDYDLNQLDDNFHCEIKKGLTIIGMPIHQGKLSDLAVRQLNKFSAEKQICIVVVSYCDKDYKKSLIALKNQVSDNGFIPIATAAFIGENKVSGNDNWMEIDHLDEADYEACINFGIKIKNKLISDREIINSVLTKEELKEKE